MRRSSSAASPRVMHVRRSSAAVAPSPPSSASRARRCNAEIASAGRCCLALSSCSNRLSAGPMSVPTSRCIVSRARRISARASPSRPPLVSASTSSSRRRSRNGSAATSPWSSAIRAGLLPSTSRAVASRSAAWRRSSSSRSASCCAGSHASRSSYALPRHIASPVVSPVTSSSSTLRANAAASTSMLGASAYPVARVSIASAPSVRRILSTRDCRALSGRRGAPSRQRASSSSPKDTGSGAREASAAMNTRSCRVRATTAPSRTTSTGPSTRTSTIRDCTAATVLRPARDRLAACSNHGPTGFTHCPRRRPRVRSSRLWRRERRRDIAGARDFDDATETLRRHPRPQHRPRRCTSPGSSTPLRSRSRPRSATRLGLASSPIDRTRQRRATSRGRRRVPAMQPPPRAASPTLTPRS